MAEGRDFFLCLSEELLPHTHLVLPQRAVRHVVSSLRKCVGDVICVTNGIGMVAQARILRMTKQGVELEVLPFTAFQQGAPRIHLGVAALKNPRRLEWAIEKAIEIGVKSVCILQTERTVRPYGKKHERLTEIITSALQQSQRAWMPECRVDIPFDHWVKECSAAKASLLLAHCNTSFVRTVLWQVPLRGDEDIYVAIGPEGDFSQGEIALAQQAGWTGVHLADNPLRSETAAVYSLAILSAS